MAAKTLDFRAVDWPPINAALAQRIEAESPTVLIKTKDEFNEKVDDVVCIITLVLDENLDKRRPNPFKRHWWTKELTLLKKKQNCVSSKSFKLRHLCDHPIHAEYRASTNKFKEVMHKTRDQNWKDWLESISQQDLYIANRYITSEPTDYSSARIPTLRTTTNKLPDTAEANLAKAEALTGSIFPPPPTVSHVPPNHIYPMPLHGPHFFLRSRIRQVIKLLSPFKAPGPDKIPNVVLMKCIDMLIDHIFFIFRAVFELKVYHSKWLESITLILRKNGKMVYDIAKSDQSAS